MIQKSTIEKLLDLALTSGSEYADLRAENVFFSNTDIMDKNLDHVESRKRTGVGFKVIFKGALGFAATSDIENKEELSNMVRKAIRYAKASAKYMKKPIIQAPIKICQDKYQIKEKIPLETLSIEEQTEIMIDCCRWLKISDKIKKTIAYSIIDCRHEVFASTEGAFIESQNNRCSLDVTCIAMDSGQIQRYNKKTGGSGGWELAIDHPWEETCEQMAKDAISLTTARSIDELKTTVIMDPEFNFLMSHEICGHPAEADRWLGWESAWAGRAWWSEMLGKQVGSELMNVSCDMTIEGNSSFTKYDSEGTPTRKTPIIKNGVLVGALHSRQTAAELNVDPTGHAIAVGAGYLPIVRMGNTFFEPGDWKPEEILADTKDGIYVFGSDRPSIDQLRKSWKIGAQKAYYVKNGELGEILRNITVGGDSPTFFSSINAIANDLQLSNPIANCYKGLPGQLYYTGNGGPTIRSQAIIIGARA